MTHLPSISLATDGVMYDFRLVLLFASGWISSTLYSFFSFGPSLGDWGCVYDTYEYGLILACVSLMLYILLQCLDDTPISR